jgi:transcriptional regulator with GAF, ATPase, and Fis domain
MSREATVRPKLAFDGHVARFGAPASLDASLSPLASRVLCAAVDRLDDVIEDALESAASALGVDRAGIVWQSDLARLPWYSRQLRRGDPVVLGRLPDDLPGEALPEAQAAAALGLKSHLLLPLRSGDEVLGGLELASFRSCRHWSAKEVASLELLAGALASALCRRRTEERLRAAELHVAELERARDELQRGTREARPLKEAWDAEPAYAKRVPYRTQGFERLIGTSGTLAKVLYQVERVASTESPVLILGETGTGKELVARAIHENSRRKARPLVPVNCAALPDTLIESELFGYEKGAFTGAATRTFGRFEHAHGGSILLDEIGELPLGAQAKLLRVLESGSFERLGSAKPVRVDVRVLAATNRDLEKDVREGRFRADLY